jgi:hypothetical protein
VFRLEFRRYLRWRPLRRWLFGWALLGVLSAVGIWTVAVQGDALRSLGAWGRMLLGLLYVSPTWAGFSCAVLLTQRLAGDKTRRGELHDLYLTALAPFAIVLGKVAASWALAGIMMAAVAPASALAAVLMGVPSGRWLSALPMGWVMLFWLCGAVYRLQWRTVPAPEIARWYRLEFSVAAAVLTGLGLIVMDLFVGVFSTQPLLSALPAFHLFPWQAMLRVDTLYPTPVGQVPAWAFLTLFSLLGGLVFIVAAAQWLSWWSLWGYRFQRVVGSALLITTATLCFTTIAPQTVIHPRSGERLFFWGLFVCLLVSVMLTRYVLGYYGIPRGQDASAPTGGMIREWVLFGTLAILTAWVIQASSGVALNGARLTALGVYLGGWLYLVQQLSAGLAAVRLKKLQSIADAGQHMVAEVGLLPQHIGCFTAIIWMPLIVFTEPILRQVLYYPLLITPLGGFLSLDFPTWAYWVYGLYTALFGVALGYGGQRKSLQEIG